MLSKFSMQAVCMMVFFVLLISACSANPTAVIELGGILREESFDQLFVWEQYTYAEQNVDFRIENGVYRAQASDGGFMWVLDLQPHTDVSIQVDIQQLSTYRDNAYGLMCRASPTNNGNGYYFLISGDGQYTIRSGAADSIDALIPWTGTNAIQRDQSINRMRIVCAGDYLALYVNGEFVAETRDDRYQRGYAGLVAGVPDAGDVDVTFDALTIWSARLLENDQ